MYLNGSAKPSCTHIPDTMALLKKGAIGGLSPSYFLEFIMFKSRRSPLFLLPFMLTALACEQQTKNTQTPETSQASQPSTHSLSVTVSDELPLPSPATGIAFWDHPTLSFNSPIIVASENGLTAYTIEDGSEAARLDAVTLSTIAVSYAGYGPDAIGIVAGHNKSNNALSFVGIDNISRQFIPLAGEFETAGDVRGICFGRNPSIPEPTAFVIKPGEIQFTSIVPTQGGVTFQGDGRFETPDNIIACTVDTNGVLIALDNEGSLYRLDETGGFSAPLARTGVKDAAGLGIISSSRGEAPKVLTEGQIIVVKNNNLVVTDHRAGTPLGTVTVNVEDLPSRFMTSTLMAASASNLGALYRNGALGFTVITDDGPALHVVPVNNLLNELDLPAGEPINPRGALPDSDTDQLIIKTNFPAIDNDTP